MEISSVYDAAESNLMRQEAQLAKLSEEVAGTGDASSSEMVGKAVELNNAQLQTKISMKMIKNTNEMYKELLSNIAR